MDKVQLHQMLKNKILNLSSDKVIFIGIDGVDTSGKTTLTNELSKLITERPVIVLSIDGFHNPKEIRIQQGEFSPEGYYYYSFNYKYLAENVFDKLKSGIMEITSKIYDYRVEEKKDNSKLLVPANAIIFFEGVFLHRKELNHYWDFSIFLDISFETVINRALKRDLSYFKEKDILLEKYNRRYIPGQKMYLQTEEPKSKADIIIDYNNYDNPIVLKEKQG